MSGHDPDRRALHRPAARSAPAPDGGDALRAMLASLVDASDDAIIAQSLDGTVVIWSRGAERVYGYLAANAVGQSILRIIPPDRHEEHAQYIERIRRGERVPPHETVRLRSDGARIYVSLTLSPVFDPGGRVVAAVGIGRNITEQKQAEEELRRRDEELRFAQDAGGMGAWSWNARTDEVTWSPSLEAIHGLTPGTCGGRLEAFLQNIHPDDVARVRRAIADAVETGTHDIEYRVVWPDGSMRWVHGRGQVLRDTDGRPARMTGVCMDVTARKRSEQEREEFVGAAQRRSREAHELARLARSLTEDLALPAVADRTVQSVLPLFGATSSRLRLLQPDGSLRAIAWSGGAPDHSEPDNPLPPGTGVSGRVVAERRPVCFSDLRAADGIVFSGEMRRRLSVREDRAILGVPLRTKGRIIGTLTIRDRAGRAFSEDEIELLQAFADQAALAIRNVQLLERAEAARREAEGANRAKDEFLAVLSHELRTPLNAVLGWARMLRAGRLDAEAARRAIEVIERNAEAQSQLIEDLLDISRIISGKLRLDVRPVNLVIVVEAATDSLRPTADAKAIRIQPTLDPRAGPVSGDPDRLQQVVWNLLSNAIKFTPKGGRIQVRLQRVNSHVEIVVSDTGRGIERDVLPHVFERFRQADSTSTRTHGGLGIGLALVKHLVELHGGTVRAESPGAQQGATFTVELPLMVHREPGWDDRAHPTAGAGGGLDPAVSLAGVRVLVVDDDPDALEMLTHLLGQHGAEVTTAASASAAVEVLERWCPHVLLTDIEMPGEDGYALMRRVRALAADRGWTLPAVALTAYGRLEDRIRTLSAGFQMHIPKPAEPLELIAVIASLAGRLRDV